MPNAFCGNILRVDLSKGKIAVEHPDEHFYRTYIGGRTLIAYYLLKEVPPGIDALAPENKLIFGPGILTGLPIPGTSRHSIGAKNCSRGFFNNYVSLETLKNIAGNPDSFPARYVCNQTENNLSTRLSHAKTLYFQDT